MQLQVRGIYLEVYPKDWNSFRVVTKFIFNERLLSLTTRVNALPSPLAVIFVSWYSGCVAVNQEMNCCNAFPLTGRNVFTYFVCLPLSTGNSTLAQPRNTSLPKKSIPYTDKHNRGHPYVFVDWKVISIGNWSEKYCEYLSEARKRSILWATYVPHDYISFPFLVIAFQRTSGTSNLCDSLGHTVGNNPVRSLRKRVSAVQWFIHQRRGRSLSAFNLACNHEEEGRWWLGACNAAIPLFQTMMA